MPQEMVRIKNRAKILGESMIRREVTVCEKNSEENAPRVVTFFDEEQNKIYIIHKSVGCGNTWFLDSEMLGIYLKNLETENLVLAEALAKAVIRIELMKKFTYYRHLHDEISLI